MSCWRRVFDCQCRSAGRSRALVGVLFASLALMLGLAPLAAFSAEGGLAWAKRAGSAGTNKCDDEVKAIAVAADDSILAVGRFQLTATFGQGEAAQTALGSRGGSDVFVAKYNSNGALVWAKGAGGSGEDMALAAAALADGSFAVAGYFSNTAIFGKGEANQTSLVSAGSTDIFIARYNADGTLAWAKRAGGQYADEARGMVLLPSGKLAVTGHFQKTGVFGPGESGATSLVSAGNTDIFVARYNPDGTIDRAWRAGGASYDYASGISAFADGSTVITGDFQGLSVFGKFESHETALVSAGNEDIYVAKYDPDGLLVWASSAYWPPARLAQARVPSAL
jgi:uncharacterized delta-60 repeat protein